jgi:hypothetical protein
MSTMIIGSADLKICFRPHRSQADRLGTSIKAVVQQFILKLRDVKEMTGTVMAVINREA